METDEVEARFEEAVREILVYVSCLEEDLEDGEELLMMHIIGAMTYWMDDNRDKALALSDHLGELGKEVTKRVWPNLTNLETH